MKTQPTDNMFQKYLIDSANAALVELNDEIVALRYPAKTDTPALAEIKRETVANAEVAINAILAGGFYFEHDVLSKANKISEFALAVFNQAEDKARAAGLKLPSTEDARAMTLFGNEMAWRINNILYGKAPSTKLSGE